ncbi:MAG: 2-isopropylmalate synthase, partial [Nitrososphaeria archaeon]|nr:2-isopropylmalate synthase [Nitrososphaeria archaeon]
LGKHSGRHAFEKRLEELGYSLTKEELDEAFKRFKELADKKKEITDRDLEALIKNGFRESEEMIKLEHLQVVSGLGIVPTATIVIDKRGEKIKSVNTGNGPVDAVYKAISESI